MGLTVIRWGLVTTAAIAAAWLALGLWVVERQSEGAAALDRGVRAAEVEPARRALRDARRLNADKAALILEGYVLSAAGRQREAVAIGERAVRQEPENLEAWSLVYVASQDRQRKEQALRRVRQLDPYALGEVRSAVPTAPE